VAIAPLTSVPMSVGWRPCAAPATSSGSTPTSGASRSTFRSAGRLTIAPGTGRTAVAMALDQRRRWLTDKGYATDLGDGRVRAPRDLIQPLEARDVERAGTALAAARGRKWRPAVPGNYVSGQLVGSTQLSSGRFAMIDDGLSFSLVPWRPALEQHIGRVVSGVAMAGGDVDWSLGRSRGLGL
jgi:Protein of unknown function (DUF3363)